MVTSPVPDLRIAAANDCELRPDGSHVLYWMNGARRPHHNFALDRAIEHARSLGKPLIVLEALRCGYQWASDRFHRFILEGMRANAAAFEGSSVRYYPYVEPAEGAGKGLVEALAADACVVIADDFPCFFLPRANAAAAARVPCLMELVDSNGLLPMRAPGDKVFARAVDLRRWLQRNIAPHLTDQPRKNPLARLELPRARIARSITDRWPAATSRMLAASPGALAELPIDHSVTPVERVTGGPVAGSRRLREFVDDALSRYEDDRNHPDRRGGSELAPWLHFGHVSVHEVFERLAKVHDWTTDALGPTKNGSRDGFWNMNPAADGFLDELVTWRELGLNFCSRRPDYDQYESLPAWAQRTLTDHESDVREHLYTYEQFDEARTHDEVWNAAQRQLRAEGRIHNYLRMVWGKMILAWTPSPQIALEILIDLNNRYALDGRNPNSYSGIFWVLGRYDRAWGPERPVFGKIRFMSPERTKAKVRMREYLARFGPESQYES
ncbi:MAG: deoxyribodipyrimidine photolyase [bacterium]|nr:deoxyribodipyrimidine photolyase [bacterium]